MTYRLTEPMRDVILTQIAARLPAKVAAQRALAPALTTDDMPDVAEFTYGARAVHVLYPAAEVLVGDIETLLDNAAQQTLRCEIGIVLIARHPDVGTLERILERYASAALEALADARVAGDFGADSLDTDNQTITPFPTGNDAPEYFERAIELAAHVTTVQTRT